MSFYSELRHTLMQADSDQLYFLKQRLTDVREILDMGYCECEACDELVTQRSLLYKQIKKEKDLLFKIKNRLISYYLENRSLEVIEYKIFSDRLCNMRRVYCRTICDTVRAAYKLAYYKWQQNQMQLQAKRKYFDLNKYNYNVLPVDPDLAVPEMDYDEDDEEPAVAFIRKTKICKNDFVFPCPGNRYTRCYEEPAPRLRNLFLLKKIRVLREQLRDTKVYRLAARCITRVKNYFQAMEGTIEELQVFYSNVESPLAVNYFEPEFEIASEALPEMDKEDAHGSNNQSESVASNVTLQSSELASKEIASEIQPSWTSFCSSDINPSYANVTNRWLQIETFKWSKDRDPGNVLASYDLPKDIITKEQLGRACHMPNLMAFNVHRYWRGDIEIKVQVNCNRFQIGQLQVAWLYAPQFDDKVLNRTNIYSLSQTKHTLITANTSNEAVMLIPYKYYLPLLHTKPRSDMPPPLSMGKLFISVINPLTVPTGGPTSANVSVFVRFLNSEFTGMLAGNIDPLANPEMDRFLSAGAAALNTLCADTNRDNPPDVRAPMYLVPTASHSWSVGTKLSEPIHPLRLDARGQTPHPPGASEFDEMNIKSVTSIYGLVKTIKWSKDQASGSIIASFDAAPFLHRKNYCSIPTVNNKQLVGYCLPPVAVASSMFMGWRGSLDFRFDVVASQYHTGRLMIAYVPGASASTKVTLAELRASTNVVYTLNDTTQFNFSVPYIANKPVWPRRYGGDYRPTDNLSPSRVYIVVLNDLIPMQNVSDSVYLNMYMRGGSDFELLVPVQPSLGLLNNREYIVNVNKPSQITAINGYSPYYSGSFEDLDHAQCFRWGTLSHQIAHFTAGNWYDAATGNYTYCAVSAKDKDNVPQYTDASGKLQPINYVVFIYLDQLGYVIGVPCRTEDHAKQLAENIFVLGHNLNDPSNTPFVIPHSWSTSSNTNSKTNIVWDVKYEKKTSPNAIIKDGFVDVGRFFSYPEGERDQDQGVSGLGTVSSTTQGKLLYGESFTSFKDLIRRYQFYGTTVINNIEKKDSDKIKFSFPCLPQGLALNIGTEQNINEIANRGRDGHIPLIASGYRFYRGGLRFRIIFDSDPDVCVYVQHRPDRILTETRIQDVTTVISGETVANHTYASYIQLTSINGLIEFEVPYYMLGLYGLLQTPKITNTDESNFFSIGEISVGVILNNLNKTPKKLLMTVYYSAADDMAFSTFQGFPPMAFNSDVPQSTLVAQPEGLIDWFISPTQIDTLTTRVVDNVATNIKDQIATSSQDVASAIKEKISNLDVNYRDSVIKMALSLTHVFVDQTPKTLVLTIIQILLEMKILIFDNITSLITSLSDAIITWVNRVSRERITDTTPIVAQPQMMLESFEAKDWTKVLSLLFAGVTASIGIACAPPTNFSRFAKIFTTHLPVAAKSGNFIMSFLNGVLDIVKMFLHWILVKVYPVEAFYYSIDSELPIIKDWVSEVNYLVRKDLTAKVDFDGVWRDRVHCAMLYGHGLIERCIESDDKQVHVLYKIQDRIEKLYDKLNAMGSNPFVRREPYCIWVSGAPGIGKSFLMEFLTSHMLQAIDYHSSSPKVFTVMPSSEFWTGCKDQPVLNLDDAFSVEMGETLEKQLNIMYMVKSPVTFNPPMANLEDKYLRYNPEIFYINSNKKYLNVAGLDASAIHRRRDILIEAKLKPHMKQSHDFSHLSFDILDSNSSSAAPLYVDLSYEKLVRLVVKHFVKYRENEFVNYNARVSTYEELREHDCSDIREVVSLRQLMIEKRREAEIRYNTDFHQCLYSKSKRFISDFSLKQLSLIDYIPNIGKLWPTNEAAAAPQMFTIQQCYAEEYCRDEEEAIPEINVSYHNRQNIVDEAMSLAIRDDNHVEYVRTHMLVVDEIPEVRKGENTVEECARVLQSLDEQLQSCSSAPGLKRVASEGHIADSDQWKVYQRGVRTLRESSEINHISVRIISSIAAIMKKCDIKGSGWRCVPKFKFMQEYLDLPYEYLEKRNIPVGIRQYAMPHYGNMRRYAEDFLTLFNSAQQFLIKCFIYPTHFDAHLATKKPEPEPRIVTHDKSTSPQLPGDLQYICDSQDYNLAHYPLSCVISHCINGQSEKKNFSWYVLSDEDRKFISTKNVLNTVDFRHCLSTDLVPLCDFNDKYYFYNKPWRIWELLRRPLSTIYDCKHMDSHVIWDFTRAVWTKHGEEYIKNTPCCSPKCVLLDPYLAKLCCTYHVLNTSLGRVLYKKRKLDQLPFYFADDLTDLDQYLDCWYSSFKVRFADIMVNTVAPKLWSALKYFSYVFVAFGSLGFITWVCKWAIDHFFPAATVPLAATSLVMRSQAADELVAPVLAEKAYTIERKPEYPKAFFSGQTPVAPQGFSQNYNDIMRKINNNAFIISAYSISEDRITRIASGRGLGLYNHRGLFIKHYYQQFLSLPLESTKFFLQRISLGNKGPKMEIDLRQFTFMDFLLPDSTYQTNFCIIEFPSYIPQFKNIISNIATTEQHKNVGTVCDIVSFGTGYFLDKNIYMRSNLQIGGDEYIDPVYCRHVYAYKHHGPGVCGSIIMGRNLPNAPIIGMHVAGLNGEGYAEPIFRDMFVQMEKKKKISYEELDLFSEEGAKVPLETTILPLGVVPPEMAHQETGITQYTPSLLANDFPHVSEPNPLSPRDPRIAPNSPMKLGCEKHGMPVRPFAQQAVEVAKLNFQDVIMSTVRPPASGARVWDLQEAICGNVDIPHCEPLDWGTSPGFGYHDVRVGHKGKRFLFDLKDTDQGLICTGLHPALKKKLKSKLQMRKDNIVPVTVFTDCLKDTCLPLDKCRIPGKTRIFSISPVDFTIQFRQYFGCFMAAYMAARFDAEHAIGINVDGSEWSTLANRMQKHGSVIIDGDYSNFGPGLSLQLARVCFDIILRWYKIHGSTSEEDQIRSIMVEEMLTAPHMCFNLIYQVYSGIPSGSPITTPLNSMVNSLLCRLAWMGCMADNFNLENQIQYRFNLPSIMDFSKYVTIVTYGDDVFMNVDKQFIGKFCMSNIIAFFEFYGIKFTNSQKNDEFHEYTTLDAISFLSRQFRKHPHRVGQYLAPLKETSIYSCINWVHKQGDLIDNTLQNANMSLWLAYGHGQDFFENLRTRLILALSKNNIKWTPPTYNYIEDQVWSEVQTPFNILPIYDLI